MLRQTHSYTDPRWLTTITQSPWRHQGSFPLGVLSVTSVGRVSHCGTVQNSLPALNALCFPPTPPPLPSAPGTHQLVLFPFAFSGRNWHRTSCSLFKRASFPVWQLTCLCLFTALTAHFLSALNNSPLSRWTGLFFHPPTQTRLGWSHV